MTRLCHCLNLCLALLAWGAPAFALIGTPDDVPAATLLLPYFEVDTTGGGLGQNTLFAIKNASTTAILAHVTVWTDESVPALDFDVYLTGYDVQTISLYDVLVLGNLPITASAGQDPGDKISPKGPVSQDINFASCSSLPYTNPAISASFRAHLQAWLQGNQSPATGNCAGSEHGDGILRGYVTVDTVNACNLFFPSDAAFYTPFLTFQNVLWGDYLYVNSLLNFADGETLVAIEACPVGTPLATCFPLGHTFYGRYNGATMVDRREALPTTMAGHYINGGAFSGGTDFIIWREANATAAGYTCFLPVASAAPRVAGRNHPSWYPLGTTQIVLFGWDEQPVTTPSCPSGDPTCTTTILIPNEAQKINVATDLLAPFSAGWAYLNLQHSGLVYPDNFAQMWLEVRMEANGRFSVGFNGVALDNANAPITTIIPVP